METNYWDLDKILNQGAIGKIMEFSTIPNGINIAKILHDEGVLQSGNGKLDMSEKGLNMTMEDIENILNENEIILTYPKLDQRRPNEGIL